MMQNLCADMPCFRRPSHILAFYARYFHQTKLAMHGTEYTIMYAVKQW